TLDDRTTVEALWPPEDISDGVVANDRSLVLRVVCDGRSVLLPGDVQADAQAALLAEGASLAADVLVLPHHGAWARTLPAFVRAVDPEVVLISSDESLDDRSTSEDRQVFFDSLRHAAAVYITDEHGWIRLRFGVDGLAVHTLRDEP
ncbi:MAG: ComEC/Rec2 family competence protein, partial [Planctomycetota bacterium]